MAYPPPGTSTAAAVLARWAWHPSAIDWTGKGAPLEELMGGRGLGKRGSYQFGTDGSARAILDLARQDARAADFVGAGFDELARHVLTCVLLLDPQRVVIGGGMSRASDLLLDPLRARLRAVLAFPPEIVHSSFGADASLLGAIELARRGVAGTRSPLQTSSQAP